MMRAAMRKTFRITALLSRRIINPGPLMIILRMTSSQASGS
jgi:hypothetical protein